MAPECLRCVLSCATMILSCRAKMLTFALCPFGWLPSLRRGEAYKRKADAYSFAIVLWEILAGRRANLFARKREQLVSYVGKINAGAGVEEFGIAM